MTPEGMRLICFNPCFDGSVARGRSRGFTIGSTRGFNPCFDGSVAREKLDIQDAGAGWVSILVLMEV